ncbi:VOC family protein [Paenibacillus filicis]|uniref:VOC family protein n=1 Tax=Paenibacillus gyeongsangnamensis TaxID=3388067 RepID=A0ABT4QCM8_9BACL|nr:VOC family protein [Paenibacillus filicis]MCZ8514606.1 VOC family protein [Paenibacillus filicis]
MIKQMATVAIYVEDQQAALTFWTEKAGFEVAADHPMGPNARWIEVRPQGAESRLVLYPKTMMPNWNELKPSIVFECDDIQGTYERMSAGGVEFVDKPNVMSWGTYAKFKDNDGNEFLLKG